MKFKDIQWPLACVLLALGWVGMIMSIILCSQGGDALAWVYTALPFWIAAVLCTRGYDWVLKKQAKR